jgi:hypothetical protein
LLGIELVELRVGVAGITHGRGVVADEVVEHRGGIVGRLRRRPDGNVKAPRNETVEIGLGLDLHMLGRDADLAPTTRGFSVASHLTSKEYSGVTGCSSAKIWEA